MRRRSKTDALEDHALQTEMIGLIYDSAAEPEYWLHLLERLSDCLDSPATTFSMLSLEAGGAEVSLPASFGLARTAVRDYERHYGAIDPILDAASRHPAGTTGCFSAFVPDEEFVRSEFYSDFYAREGLRYGFKTVIRSDPGIVCTLACHRPPDHGRADEAELRFLERLTPHLQRACTISTQLDRLRNQQSVVTRVLDGLPVGLVFVDRAGMFLRANSRGEHILQQEDGLAVRSGQLTASDEATTARLRSIVANACDAEPLVESSAVLSARVGRPSGRRDLDVMACPIVTAASDWADEPAAAYLVISDGSAELEGAAARLRELYGLSEVESELAVAIANGRTVKEQAIVRGVSVETVRWQLKQVFAKTGTSGQPELIRLVLLGPLIARN